MTGEADPHRYSEVIEAQWALVRDIVAPGGGGYWLAGVDAPTLARRRAKDRGARDLAGFVAGHIARAEPFFWASPIARAVVDAARTLPKDLCFAGSGDPTPTVASAICWPCSADAQTCRTSTRIASVMTLLGGWSRRWIYGPSRPCWAIAVWTPCASMLSPTRRWSRPWTGSMPAEAASAPLLAAAGADRG